MSDLKTMAAMTALNNMLAKGHFDICVMRSVSELLNVTLSGESYKILGTLHCVDYAKMPTELRDAIPSMIQDCLGVAPVFQFKTLEQQTIEISPTAGKKILSMIGFGS